MIRRPIVLIVAVSAGLTVAACSSDSAGNDPVPATADADAATTELAGDDEGAATTEPSDVAATTEVAPDPTEAPDSTTAETAAPPATDALTTVEFDLLTYNVAGLPAVLSGSEPDINTALIGPILNDYDVVVVQESWRTPDPNPDDPLRVYHEILMDTSEHEFTSEPAVAPVGTDPDRPSARLGDGLNRFSDFPLGEVERNRWTTCGEASADCLSLKGFSVSTIDFDGLEVDLYNLHLDAGREDFAVRADNVAELIAHIVEQADGHAVMVAGDFNLHLDRDPDADQFAELLASTGLVDVCTDLGCAEPNRIDKVLYRSSDDVVITPLEWRNESAVFTRDDGEPLSDHDPVVVHFSVVGA